MFEGRPFVDCIASGYEWKCPECEKINHISAWEEEVQCLGCQGFFNLNGPVHCVDD